MTENGFLNYPGSVEDKRKRAYVPPCRIVWASEGENKPVRQELLVGNTEIQPYFPSEPRACLLKPGAGVLLDYGRELHGGVRLVVGASGGRGRVRVRFGESVGEAMGTPNNDHANHDSVIDLPMLAATEFGATAFRFVRLDVPEDSQLVIQLLAAPAVALYHDLEYVGAFKSSDARLDEIWKTGAYTVHLNMQDYVYDGVKRDRLVWMGDLHPEVSVIAAVFDDSALVERSMDFVRDRTPSGEHMNGISSYCCWWVVCQHDWFMAKGNRDYLRSQRDYLLPLLRQLASWVDASGRETLPGRRFLDWPSNDDKAALHAGLQGLLAWTLDRGERLCRFLSEPETAAVCASARDSLRSHIPDHVANKAAAAMQVLGGVGDAAALNREVLAANPLSGVSTFYGYYVLQARAALGDITGAMELVRRYWGAMLDFGATTFWEDFNLDWTKNAGRIDELAAPGKDDLHADFGAYCYKGLRHSLCHGWAGGPTAWLSEQVLGIRALTPGMGEVEFRPRLGDLEWVEGAVPTPRGPIHCRARRKADGSVESECEAPAGTKVVTRGE